MKKIAMFLALTVCLSHFGFAQTADYSLNFDGIDDNIIVNDPSNGSLDFGVGQNFTVLLWINTTNTPASPGTGILDKRRNVSGNHQEGYNITMTELGKIYFSIEDINGNYSQGYGNVTVNDGSWHCIVLTRDVATDQVTLYVDGVLDLAITDNTTATLAGTSDLYIGRWQYYSRYFVGKIDDVSIWSIAMNTTMIASYMACPPSGADAALLSFWSFEEGTGSSTDDIAVANANTGTFISSPVWTADAPPYTCSTLGTPEEDMFNATLTVYPNPTSGILRLETPELHSGLRVEIMDITGKKVLDKSLIGNSLDVSELANGTYVISVEADGVTYKQKFIKN